MNTITRLKEFIDAIKISIKKFEETVDLSNGTIRKAIDGNKSIGTNTVEKIIANYPDLNIDWLFTGRGVMFWSNTVDNDEVKHEEKVQWYNEQLNKKTYAYMELLENYNQIVVENAKIKEQLEQQSKSQQQPQGKPKAINA